MKKVIMILLLLIFIFATILFLRNLFFPDNPETLYGNRLDNIEDYSVNNIDEIKIAISNLDSVSNTSIRIQGKKIDIIVTLPATSKTIKTDIKAKLELFGEEALSFYDIQVFIKTSEETENFPIIGYKNNNSKDIVWTN